MAKAQVACIVDAVPTTDMIFLNGLQLRQVILDARVHCIIGVVDNKGFHTKKGTAYSFFQEVSTAKFV